MLLTTLREIQVHMPSLEGWHALLRKLGKFEADDEPLPVAAILHSVGLHDALWCLRASAEGRQVAVQFALLAARQVESGFSETAQQALAVGDDYLAGREMNAGALEAAVEQMSKERFETRFAPWTRAWAVRAVSWALRALATTEPKASVSAAKMASESAVKSMGPGEAAQEVARRRQVEILDVLLTDPQPESVTLPRRCAVPCM